MEWYNIIAIIIGSLGGVGGVVGGIVSIYNAKSNKDTIDISNFHSLIEEERKEREILRTEYTEYKETVEEKIISVKKDFEKLQKDNKKMLASIYQAYRCKLPEKLKDCPVIMAFNKDNFCEDCDINK